MGQTFLGAHDTYAVVREIGRGAFGTVLEVEREEDRRRYALKAFHAGKRAELEKVREFHRSGIAGDRIASIVEVASSFAVFELLPASLESFLGRDLDEAAKRRLVEEVLSAIGELHDLGLVHGDVKPSNLMVEDLGGKGDPEDLRVKVVDFGLAAEMDSEALELSFTGTAGVEGTLDYLSPERREPGHRPDPKDDLFSAGVVFFQILAGRPAREALLRKAELPEVFQKFLSAEEKRPGDARKALMEVWDHWRANSREARVGRASFSRRRKEWKGKHTFFRGVLLGSLLSILPGWILIVFAVAVFETEKAIPFDPVHFLWALPAAFGVALLLPHLYDRYLERKGRREGFSGEQPRRR
ncbi:MAG: protein kinase [Planctomycetes bacterium]|jgi:serine/threonine protein kinase|nr:protein kinase [Planctomycetota bacterium]